MTTLATRNHVSATHAVTQLAIRLTSGDKDPIRGMKAPDGRTVFSVYDAMWNTGAYAGRSGVKMAFARLIANGSEYKEEVVKACDYLKFAGPGQRNTPCMDLRGLQRLIALLGGKIGAEYRALAETTLTRLVAGDESMIAEIEENAASDAPIQVLAREALAIEAPGIKDDDFEALALMSPEHRQAFVTALTASAAAKERLGTARALVVQAEAEAESKLVDAFGRRISFEVSVEQQRAEIDRVRAESERASLTTTEACAAAEHKRKRETIDMAEELGEIIKRFALTSPEERELLRHTFSAQISSVIPSKRIRDRFVAKLVSAPAAAEPEGGVYVLRLEDGTFYVGESRNTEVRIAQHKAGQGAAFTMTLGATAVSVPPLTSGSAGYVQIAPSLARADAPLFGAR